MKAAIAALVLAACTYNTIPPPQPARTVCYATGSTVYTGNYSTSGAYGECRQLPADRCYGVDSPFCRSLEEVRLARNREVDHRRNRDIGLALGISAVVVLAVVIGASQ